MRGKGFGIKKEQLQAIRVIISDELASAKMSELLLPLFTDRRIRNQFQLFLKSDSAGRWKGAGTATKKTKNQTEKEEKKKKIKAKPAAVAKVTQKKSAAEQKEGDKEKDKAESDVLLNSVELLKKKQTP